MTSLAGGGAERVMLYLAEGLSQAGHEVDLVVTRAQGAYLGMVPPSVRLVDLRCRRIRSALFPLVRYLRSVRPAVVLSSLTPSNCLVLWARRIACISTRIVVVEHGIPTQKAQLDGLRGRMILQGLRFTYPSAEAIVAVSGGVAEDLDGILGNSRRKIALIYNPVVTKHMLQLAEEDPEHPWLRQGEPPVLLAVGRLVAEKDYDTMLRAFALLRQSHAAKLIILGEGEERSRIEKVADDLGVAQDLSMPGFVENPFPYMRCASALVLSSRSEGFGMVLVEALACGGKVISTCCPGGPAEVLEHGKWGRLVPVGDAPALAAAMRDTLEEPTGSNSLDGRLRANDYAVEHAVERYREVLFPDRFAE